MSINETMGTNIMQIGSAIASTLDESIKQQLVSIKPLEWYPIEMLTNIIDQAVSKGLGRLAGRANIYFVKEHIVELGLKSPEMALRQLDALYRQFNRGTELGKWDLLDLVEGRAEIGDSTIYDCTFNEGILEGFVTSLGCRLLSLEHVKCRKRGDERCVYQLQWKQRANSSQEMKGA